jgi:hypothetical protein
MGAVPSQLCAACLFGQGQTVPANNTAAESMLLTYFDIMLVNQKPVRKGGAENANHKTISG